MEIRRNERGASFHVLLRRFSIKKIRQNTVTVHTWVFVSKSRTSILSDGLTYNNNQKLYLPSGVRNNGRWTCFVDVMKTSFKLVMFKCLLSFYGIYVSDIVNNKRTTRHFPAPYWCVQCVQNVQCIQCVQCVQSVQRVKCVQFSVNRFKHCDVVSAVVRQKLKWGIVLRLTKLKFQRRLLDGEKKQRKEIFVILPLSDSEWVR